MKRKHARLFGAARELLERLRANRAFVFLRSVRRREESSCPNSHAFYSSCISQVEEGIMHLAIHQPLCRLRFKPSL